MKSNLTKFKKNAYAFFDNHTMKVLAVVCESDGADKFHSVILEDLTDGFVHTTEVREETYNTMLLLNNPKNDWFQANVFEFGLSSKLYF